jgi:hypothetical protein
MTWKENPTMADTILAHCKRWKKLAKQAVKNFKPIERHYTIDTCPDCYGTQPQGGEMAYIQGCNDCELKSECGKITHKLYEQARKAPRK